MERYGIRRQPDGRLTILYREAPGAPSFECGTRPADTPIEPLPEWIIQYASPGDVLEVPGGCFVNLRGGCGLTAHDPRRGWCVAQQRTGLLGYRAHEEGGDEATEQAIIPPTATAPPIASSCSRCSST